MISSLLKIEALVTLQNPDQQMIQLIDLVEWHHYPTHAIFQDPPANF